MERSVTVLFWLLGAVVAYQVAHLPPGNGVEEIFVRAGHNTSLPCHPAMEPTLIFRVEWYHNDRKVIEVDADARQKVLWDVGPHVSLHPNTYALKFRNVLTEDSGRYTCVVNEKEHRGVSVNLFVQDVPEPPGMPLSMGFSSRHVNLSWAPSRDSHFSPITHYIIHLKVGEEGKWEVTNRILTPDNKTSFQVTGLKPFTVYSFRVVAVNAIGPSQPSKVSYYSLTLREVPNGKPTITAAYNVSSTAIRLEWKPPPPDTIHGEFLGYRIAYRPRDRPASEERELKITNSEITSYTLGGLRTFTKYLISVQVFNPEGYGPPATVSVTTDEWRPTAPQNLTLVRVTDDSMRLRWQEPEAPNGKIHAYKVYLMYGVRNHSEVRLVKDHIYPSMDYIVQDLKPFTRYQVFVKALTKRYEGEPSKAIEVQTDVNGPSEPTFVNVTCKSLDALYLQWRRPHTFHNNIDYYFVYFKAVDSSLEFEERALPTSHDRSIEALTIPNLTAHRLYEVKVRGATRSVVEHTRIYKGPFSESYRVLLQPDCLVYPSPYSGTGVGAGVIAGIICVLLIIILTALGVLFWRKYFQAAYYYLDDPLAGTRSSPQPSETFEDPETAAIPVELWVKHVAELHADGDIGFSREYESIQQAIDPELSSEFSQLNENKTKNRYVNIVAYDHSRVILNPIPGQKKTTDYINANYIDGYNKPRAYIGTQGPLPSTFDDYWRMIWEQKVHIMVMITNLMERGRKKCDLYWPQEGTEVYGIMQVRLVRELVMATYIIRTFTITNLRVKKGVGERTVYQYHYTNWPDHGVPDHPLPVLSFVLKSSRANPPGAGPIIVHCSAGVGRTGTYIVLDAMLKQIRHRGTVNVYGFLRHIRSQRNYLVQTEEQYIFVHDALLEAIESGETEIALPQLPAFLQELLTPGDTSGEDNKVSYPLLDKHFKLVISFTARDYNVVSAVKPCNKAKNRSLNVIPLESYRVHIAQQPDGSDYINATFLPGFHRLREFILTQHPLVESDLWQVIWDYNCQTMVLLSSLDNKDYPCFWAGPGEERQYSTFRVKHDGGGAWEGEPQLETTDFTLRAVQDEHSFQCRLFHWPGWPDVCTPLAAVWRLVQLVQDWQADHPGGPIVVIDRYGGRDGATFCCLTTFYKQLKYENSFDAYMYAKLYHMRRPGIWRTREDYIYLYRAVEAGYGTGEDEVTTNGMVLHASNNP